MKLSTKGRYAVMAMADLAQRSGGRPVALAEVAVRQEISLSYLEQLFGRLRRGGLVKSVRGPGGGYMLARDPEQMRIADIILAVDEPIKATRCTPGSPQRLPFAPWPLPHPRSVGRTRQSDLPVSELGDTRRRLPATGSRKQPDDRSDGARAGARGGRGGTLSSAARNEAALPE